MNNKQEELLKVIALAEAVQKDLTLAITRAKAEYETYLIEIPEPKQEDLPWEEPTSESIKSFYMMDFTNDDKTLQALKFIADSANQKFILNLDGYKFHKLFVGSTTPKDNKCIYLPWVGHNTYGLNSVNAYEIDALSNLGLTASEHGLLNAATVAIDNSDFVIIANDDSKESKSVLLQEIRNICKNQNKPLYNITKEKDLKDLVNYVNQA